MMDDSDEPSGQAWLKYLIRGPGAPHPPAELIHVVSFASDCMQHLVKRYGIQRNGIFRHPPGPSEARRVLLEYLRTIGELIDQAGYWPLLAEAYGDIPPELPINQVADIFSGEVWPIEDVLCFCLGRIGCADKVLTTAAVFLHAANHPSGRHERRIKDPTTTGIRRAVLGVPDVGGGAINVRR